MVKFPLLWKNIRQPSGSSLLQRTLGNVNKNFDLGVTVVNFLNQKGAKGTINGSELITKDEASKYAGCYMSGTYLRPFTVEFSASIKF